MFNTINLFLNKSDNYDYTGSQWISWALILIISLVMMIFSIDTFKVENNFVKEMNPNKILVIILGVIYLIILFSTLYNAWVSNFDKDPTEDKINSNQEFNFWLMGGGALCSFVILIAWALFTSPKLISYNQIEEGIVDPAILFNYFRFKDITSVGVAFLVFIASLVDLFFNKQLKANGNIVI